MEGPASLISLDLAARRVVMASMLYYGLDVSMMSDGEFDALCKRLSDNWKDLSPQRRFALGSAEKIRASGYHVRVSTIAQDAAINWMIQNGIYVPGTRKVYQTQHPKFSKTIGHWLPCTAYQWGPAD